jgi:hypothetical protein
MVKPQALWLTVLLVATWTVCSASSPSKDDTGKQVTMVTANSSTPSPPQVSNSSSNLSSELPAAPNGAKICQKGTEDRTSSLCAEWKAADASGSAARYALWSVLLTSISAALLVWTLWETRQTTIRDQRAYVRAEPAHGGVVLPNRRVFIPMNLINYGKTPAISLAVHSAIVVRAPGWDWSDEPESDQVANEGDRTNLTVHPDCPHLIRLEMTEPLPETVFESILIGGAVVFARGTISYKDVFSRARMTTFQIEFHGEDRGDGNNGRVRLAARGNDFT